MTVVSRYLLNLTITLAVELHLVTAMCPLGLLVTAKYLSAPVQWFIERWCVLAAVCTRCCSAAVLQAELPRLAASVLSRRSAAAEFTRESRA